MDNSDIRQYFCDIDAIPLLSAEEQKNLIKKYQNGDEDAKNQLIEANLRLVASIARSYCGRGVQYFDLIQQGTFGLIKGIEKFDVKFDTKLSTFCTYWIKQAIGIAIVNTGRSIRIPSYVYSNLTQIKKFQNDFLEKFGELPSDEEIAAEFHFSVKYVIELYAYMNDIGSLDVQIDSDSDSTFMDVVEDQNAVDAVDCIYYQQLKTVVNNVLSTLKPKEAEIIKLRFGLSGEHPMTLQEIGKRYNVTRQWIRQVEMAAMFKLRNPVRTKALRTFYEGAV